MEDTTKQFGERNYDSLYNILQAYRRAGANTDTYVGEFNRFDNPSTFYFRIFFDFTKGLINGIGDLGDTQQNGSISANEDFTKLVWSQNRNAFNASAINYLLLNNEWERADMLREFINLLSNINTYSPWYFSEISGLSEVMDRTEFTGDGFTIGDPKIINIKCLPDAFDTRIGTLLDLYRSACFSWQLHKEIIPANLRRFDMYIYVFNASIRGVHSMYNNDGKRLEEGYATFDQNQIKVSDNGFTELRGSHYITSSKLFHLQDCEIDLNASKSGFESLNNMEGFEEVYTIPIKVNNAVEQRFNEILHKRIGDLVIGDMDLPQSDSDNVGNLRRTIWNKEEADNWLTVDEYDDRLSKESLNANVHDDNYEPPKAQKNIQRSDDNISLAQRQAVLGKNINNTGKSVLDPWLSILKKQTANIDRQLNQSFKQIKSTVNSLTDPYQLSKAAADATLGKTLNKLIWGNMFETNLQQTTQNINSGIGELSSHNLFDNATNGWFHSTIDRQPVTPNQIGESMFEH